MSEAGLRQFPPIPSHLSSHAREFLANRAEPYEALPDLGDVDGWLEYIRNRDEQIAARYSSSEPSPEVKCMRVAEVDTYVVYDSGPEDPLQSPIYLYFHGGALVFGGGPLCGLMARAGALDTGMTTWAPDYHRRKEQM